MSQIERPEPSGMPSGAADRKVTPSFVTDPWSLTVIQPFVIACMMTALFVGIAAAWQAVSPNIAWVRLGFLFFVIALEATFTTIWLYHPDRRILDRSAYRAAELIVIVLLVRLYSWLVLSGGLPGLEEWRSYLLNPLLFFTSDAFPVSLIFTLFLWQRAGYASETFRDLAISEAEVWYYSLPPTKRAERTDQRPRQISRSHLVANFSKQWLWGGIILCICTGLSTLRLSELSTTSNPLAIARLGLRPELLIALLVYFIAGFWLLSQGQLAVANTRWMMAGVTKGAQVEQSWRRYSLWLLLLIGLGAAFLPIGSTAPISQILAVIVYGGVFLLNLFFFALAFLLLMLLSLFGVQGEERVEEAQSDLSGLIQEIPPPSPGLSENTAAVLGSLFWVIILIITVVAIIFFLRDRGYPINGRLLRKVWRGFALWLLNLWRGVSIQVQEVSHSLRARLQARAGADASQTPWRFIRLNALSPREQIRYFYLSTVRRAGERGVLRRPNETPLEYVEDLKASWPEAEGEVDELTNAFLKARYSPRSINETEVSLVKEIWKRVKANLRKRHMTGPDTEAELDS